MEFREIRDSYTKSAELFHNVTDNEMVEIAARQWGRYHESIHKTSLSLGIGDFRLIQPNPYVPKSKLVLTDFEKRILENDKGNSQFAVVTGYPLLRRELDALITKGVWGMDLSYIYKDERNQILVDPYHANRDGYKMVIDKVIRLIETNANELFNTNMK